MREGRRTDDKKAANVGARALRKEDRRLLTGRGRYVADVVLPGAYHMAVLRSPHGHARIVQLDVSRARALEGVLAAVTHSDLDGAKKIPTRIGPSASTAAAGLQPILAVDVVRYVGEPLVVVVATDRYVAEDAIDLIEAEFEPLPAVTDAQQAQDPDAPRLHPGVEANVLHRFHARKGDGRDALTGCPLRLRERFSVQRHTGIPLETRGFAAAYDDGTGVLTLWGPTKAPHFMRVTLADLLDYPEHLIRIQPVDVGGGFGIRGEFYSEEILIPWLALRLRRPIQWMEDRREHLMASNHSREQSHEVEVGFRPDGTIVALVDRFSYDLGAYLRTNGLVVPELTTALLPGPYRIPHYECEGVVVLTNKTPCGSYRAPGRFEANFVRERIVDLVAREVGLDPAEVRRRNFITPGDMPYEVGTSSFNQTTTFDAGDFPAVFEKALSMAEYEQVRVAQQTLRAQGRYIGVGSGCLIEKTGLGPWESSRVEIDRSGRLVLYSGATTMGEGLETTLAQICADELSVELDDVTVVFNDSALMPRGIGTYGSRGASVGGSSAAEACRRLRQKVVELAASRLEVAPSDVVVGAGRVYVRGMVDRGMTFKDLARAAEPGQPLPPGMEPVLSATSYFEQKKMDYAFGVHVAVVEVDAETGVVTLLKHVIAYDIGRAINPTIVEGQFLGGLAQGIGGTFYEHLAYDGEGQILTTTFMDYLLPTSMEMPLDTRVAILEWTPSTRNLLGVKGGAEAGVSGAGGALANAVADALEPFRPQVTTLPLSVDRILAMVGERQPARRATG